MVLGSAATPWAWDQSWSEASSSGNTAANQVLPKVNKGGKITSRFSNPLTSNASPLYTFDDNTGFNAQLTAPSSNAFVDLFIAPSSTGDLTTVTLRQDTDFDGSFDYAYSVTSPVSGVCANGFISADPGTWNNKHYFTWTADTSGRVTATEVPSLLDLAGCYCINSSCGSNLVWANIGTILKDPGRWYSKRHPEPENRDHHFHGSNRHRDPLLRPAVLQHGRYHRCLFLWHSTPGTILRWRRWKSSGR